VNGSRRLLTPWARPCDVYSQPSRVLLKLKLGEAPGAIPTALDVRAGAQSPESRFGMAEVDRILAHFADRVRVVRVHDSAASVGRVGASHRGYDELEHVLGLSRTFQVRSERACCVDDIVDALRQVDTVEWASPHYVTTTPLAAVAPSAVDPDLDLELAWASRDLVHASEAIAYEPGDRSVVCAVLDTGVVDGHPELGDNVRTAGPDTVELGTGDFAAGLELLGDVTVADRRPHDEAGHGTHCAAIIAGAGTHIPPGLASGCTVLPARVLGSARIHGRREPFGVGRIGDIDRGCKLVVDMGAKALNMSFGTSLSALDPGDPIPHVDVCAYALARGCILVAASGNSGRSEEITPACLPGVIAVGAVTNDGVPTAFTTTGAHVSLCAPGERVVTADLEGYARATGTSFAAPFVSAAAALLVSRAGRRGLSLDGADAHRLLVTSARPFPAVVPSGYGAGILDAHAALRLLDREIDDAVANGVPTSEGGSNGIDTSRPA
jgi:subtilisin family serine protease